MTLLQEPQLKAIVDDYVSGKTISAYPPMTLHIQSIEPFRVTDDFENYFESETLQDCIKNWRKKHGIMKRHLTLYCVHLKKWRLSWKLKNRLEIIPDDIEMRKEILFGVLATKKIFNFYSKKQLSFSQYNSSSKGPKYSYSFREYE